MHANHFPALRAGLTQIEVAALLNISPRSLRRWAKGGYGPRPIRDGNRLLYSPVDVEAFAAGVVA
jgi:DNA-binding transcriptional MerR regulator